MYAVDDRVIINDPGNLDNGKAGTIISVNKHCTYPYRVQIDGDDLAFWYAGSMLVTSPVIQEPEESPHDFDGGFGIGGLSRFKEKPVVPSVRAIECYERKAAKARRCRICKQTDVFDGAMFTTLGGDICDDCAG